MLTAQHCKRQQTGCHSSKATQHTCRQPLSQNSSTSHARLSLEASPLLRFEPPLGLEDADAECPGMLPESEPLCTLLHPTQPSPQVQCHRLAIGCWPTHERAQPQAEIHS